MSNGQKVIDWIAAVDPSLRMSAAQKDLILTLWSPTRRPHPDGRLKVRDRRVRSMLLRRDRRAAKRGLIPNPDAFSALLFRYANFSQRYITGIPPEHYAVFDESHVWTGWQEHIEAWQLAYEPESQSAAFRKEWLNQSVPSETVQSGVEPETVYADWRADNEGLTAATAVSWAKPIGLRLVPDEADG